MRILVTGASGRVGSQLATVLGAQDHAVTTTDIGTMDITDMANVRDVFATVQPEIVLHCAALTAVDYCAEQPDEAVAINGFGTQTVALACQAHDSALVYISTNEVFGGRTRRAYQEYDPPAPANPYGYSKWVGEQVVRDLVRKHYIIRISWLFAHGGTNFLQVILKLAREGKPLRVVTNEIGAPTYNNDLALAIARLIATERYGIYHLVNEGHTSRYAFARRALELAGLPNAPVTPIALAEYSRASRPPEYAVLRNVAAARLGITLRPWEDALVAFLEEEGLLAR